MFFITFANDDLEFVQELAAQVDAAGLHAWYDAARLDGSPIWSEEVREHLLNAQAVLLVLSPSCTASQYAVFEWASAHHAGIPIIPIMCRPCLLHPILPPAYDFTQAQDWAGLLGDLHGRFGRPGTYATQEMPALTLPAERPALDDPDPAQREKGVEKLVASLGDNPLVLNDLLCAMVTDADEGVRATAELGLIKAGVSGAFLQTAARLYDPQPQTRAAAVHDLMWLDDARTSIPILPMLRDSDMRVQQAAIEALGTLQNPHTVDALVAALDHAAPHLIDPLLKTFKRFGDKVGIPLANALPDANHKERYIEVIVALQSKAAIRPLVFQLASDQTTYSMMIARTLGRLGQAAVDEMIYIMQTTADSAVRHAIVRALGRSKKPELIPLLLNFISDTDSDTREVIQSMIVTQYGRAALPDLQAAFQHRDWAVRSAAAMMVKEMGLDPVTYGYVENRAYE